jgi:Ca2+-binding RTX toxin-like protein
MAEMIIIYIYGNGVDTSPDIGGNDILYGENGDDFIAGGAADDLVYGGEGNDTIYGDNDPTDTVVNGNDVLFGGAGDDQIIGGLGSDTLDGGDGTNTANGGDGNDIYIISGTFGVTTITDSSGSDTIRFSEAMALDWQNNIFTGQTTRVSFDRFTLDRFELSDFADTLNMSTARLDNVEIFGNGGNDTLTGGSGRDLIDGGSGNDIIRGNNGADLLLGGAGGDQLFGDAGDDTLIGGTGNDVLDGGAGAGDLANYSDQVGFFGRGWTFNAAEGTAQQLIGQVNFVELYETDTLISIEYILGSAGNDTYYAGAQGNFNGNGGIDALYLKDKTEVIYFDGTVFDDGNDVVDITTGTVTTTNGSFNDLITFSSVEEIHTGSGNDIVYGSTGADRIYGDAGNDALQGAAGNDQLWGGLGADTLSGGDGIDAARYDDAVSAVYTRLDGVAGQGGEAIGDTYVSIESLVGSAFNDTFVGGAEDNVLTGLAGDDALYGLGGNDTFYGGAGGDVLNGGTGFDFVRYDGATGMIYVRLDGVAGAFGEATGDTFNSIEGLVGSQGFGDIIVGSANADYLFGLGGDDYLYGIGGNDTLDGGTGNDQLYGGAGADVLNGGDGFDLARYDSAASAIYTRLDGVAGQSDEAVGDTYFSIEGFVGSAFGDTFVGSSTNGDYLNGLAGNDALYGLGGNDFLLGGLGIDTLVGGAGADRFEFNTALNASTNVDTITDFVAATDDIVLSQAIFAGIGTTLDAAEFGIGAAASSAGQRIVYNLATGQLLYDADGSGAGAATLFATVTAGTQLTIGDFVMVA